MPSDLLRRPESDDPAVLDFTNVLADLVGSEHGLTLQELKNAGPRLEGRIQEMQRVRRAGGLQFLDLPSDLEFIAQTRALAPVLEGMESFVLLGIGGSALGPRAILEGVWGPQHLLKAGRTGGPPRRVFLADNIDPDSFSQILDLVDLSTCLFNVVSKSGSTVETMAQLQVAWRLVEERLGATELPRHFVFTTDPRDGYLRELSRRRGIPALDIPEGVGGRYSVLTPVGLFPALAAGIDPQTLLDGAADMDPRCRSLVLLDNPAAILAAVHHLLDRNKGKTISVLMPYSDRLRAFADWFCQLWAESLGKSHSQGGEERSPVGQTPMRAVGTTDQHSQLQLFLEGPNDKLFTLMAVEEADRDLDLRAAGLADPGSPMAYLQDHTLGGVFRTEQVATEMALARAERPTLVWRLPQVGPHVLGQLFYVYQVACALAGELYHVDPFDQPAVEEGKNLTYGALGRPGYDEEREEIDRYRALSPKYRA